MIQVLETTWTRSLVAEGSTPLRVCLGVSAGSELADRFDSGLPARQLSLGDAS